MAKKKQPCVDLTARAKKQIDDWIDVWIEHKPGLGGRRYLAENRMNMTKDVFTLLFRGDYTEVRCRTVWNALQKALQEDLPKEVLRETIEFKEGTHFRRKSGLSSRNDFQQGLRIDFGEADLTVLNIRKDDDPEYFKSAFHCAARLKGGDPHYPRIYKLGQDFSGLSYQGVIARVNRARCERTRRRH